MQHCMFGIFMYVVIFMWPGRVAATLFADNGDSNKGIKES